jgi:O-acetyl-ADP-ribose deacetylase (regulator of RNase III)
MIEYTTTSIFDSPAQVLVNPVNCVGVMGKGLALEFKKRYPKNFRDYKQDCKNGELPYDWLCMWGANDGHWIWNLATKRDWRDKANINMIEVQLLIFANEYDREEAESISFPKLGCGLGGLDWEKQMKPLMERYLSDINIPVYIHI